MNGCFMCVCGGDAATRLRANECMHRYELSNKQQQYNASIDRKYKITTAAAVCHLRSLYKNFSVSLVFI